MNEAVIKTNMSNFLMLSEVIHTKQWSKQWGYQAL